MKQLTDKEANNLQKEIDHILDSGVNSIRLLEMIDMFLDRREQVKNLTIPNVIVLPFGEKVELKIVHTTYDPEGRKDSRWAIQTEHTYKEGFKSPYEALAYFYGER